MKPPLKKYNEVLKYLNLSTQMMVVILAGSLGGKYIDAQIQLSFPVFTLIGVLASVFAAVYLAIRGVLKK
ncbi:MAG: AtpZ/AtpI family protein [Bacteroidia bacterium]